MVSNFYSTTPRIQLTRQSLNFWGNLVWKEIPHHVKYNQNESPTTFRSFNSFKHSLKEFILNCGDEDIAQFVLQTRLSDWY